MEKTDAATAGAEGHVRRVRVNGLDKHANALVEAPSEALVIRIRGKVINDPSSLDVEQFISSTAARTFTRRNQSAANARETSRRACKAHDSY